MSTSKDLRDVLVEEHTELKNVQIKPGTPLDEVHRLRNQAGYSALCLSGGGIRSATFNLGLLQRFAQEGLLDKFDYLSTVSGGGFIGSWYSAWKQRDRSKASDLNEPIQTLSRSNPSHSDQPEPKPVEHLRAFSNYLSPRVGLLSADFWTLIAAYLRNVVLINLAFVPVIMAFLMIPRILFAWMNTSPVQWAFADFALAFVLALGLVSGFYAVRTVGQNLPIVRSRNDPENVYLLRCLLPLSISALCLVTFWGWYSQGGWQGANAPMLFRLVEAYPFTSVLIVGGVLLLIPFTTTVGIFQLKALLLLVAATGLTVGLTYYFTNNPLIADTRIYVTFAFPFLILLMMASATLVAGFTSRQTTDNDEEWWSRSGAWLMITMVSWIGLSILVLWVPEYVLRFFEAARNGPAAIYESWMHITVAGGGVAGVLSTIISLASSFSSITGGTESAQSKGGLKPLFSVATSLLATVALVFILGTIAALTGPLLVLLSLAAAPIDVAWTDHVSILANSSLMLVSLTTVVLMILGWALARVIDTNKFSLHYYWRNRIVRAYPGASRDRSKSQTENAFIRFDPADNLPMKELRGQKPFHVVNIALNLIGSKRLNWQERMAESFTVSPLHCGTHWLGYRESGEYASGSAGGGISLGTAVAISGAAASPNMGYMMTSPIVRILMTLFNIRLGAWMGNPGEAGSRTYKDHAPRNIILPIVQEALGQTNDDSAYVYLSDGGHFENLGLYEMVLRRCRCIVVSDASTDPSYTYESLAQAVRKIRVDFGIPIEFPAFPKLGNTPDGTGTHFAFGTIRYRQVDKECKDGFLIYIKPSLHGDEPQDVINYYRQSGQFPQETISDQFFSESQFESYRMLGWTIGDRLLKDKGLQSDVGKTCWSLVAQVG